MLGDTYEERYNQLFRGGLRIHTTLDPNLQAQAEVARDELPENAQGFDAAIVSLDSNSGAIRVMVGGQGFKPNERETNMALVPRQTGSSIKFFILAAAVQAGAQPGDVIDGVRGRACCPTPARPKQAVRDHRRACPAGVDDARRPDLDTRSTVRSPACRRSSV